MRAVVNGPVLMDDESRRVARRVKLRRGSGARQLAEFHKTSSENGERERRLHREERRPQPSTRQKRNLLLQKGGRTPFPTVNTVGNGSDEIKSRERRGRVPIISELAEALTLSHDGQVGARHGLRLGSFRHDLVWIRSAAGFSVVECWDLAVRILLVSFVSHLAMPQRC